MDKIAYQRGQAGALVRQALKESFPGQKFSVRTHRYAGGASMTIAWSDGPTAAAVRAVVDVFAGADFDGMTDCKGLNYLTLDGERWYSDVDYIFQRRDLSDPAIAEVLAAEAKKWGVTPCPTVADYRQGRLWALRGGIFGGVDFERKVNVALSDADLFGPARASPTAARVVYQGNTNDGRIQNNQEKRA